MGWPWAFSFHDGFLLTGPRMFKLSIGLRLWANTSCPVNSGPPAMGGRECNGLASGIWPWHWLFIDQSLDPEAEVISLSESLRVPAAWGLSRNINYAALRCTGAWILSHSGGTSDKSHNLSSALTRPVPTPVFLWPWDYLGYACLEIISSFSSPFTPTWFYGCFLGQGLWDPALEPDC